MAFSRRSSLDEQQLKAVVAVSIEQQLQFTASNGSATEVHALQCPSAKYPLSDHGPER